MSWKQGFRQLANAAKHSSWNIRHAVGGIGASQLRTSVPGSSSHRWSSTGCLALVGAAASIGFAPVAFAGSLDEQSFIMIKPDGVQRGLISEIIARFERKGYKLVAIKVIQPSEDVAKQHYAEHEGKPFFAGLVDFLTSGPVVAMVWEGKEVIKTGRGLIGATNPLASAPGTIRGDFGVETGRNLIHGSDGIDAAQKEIALWFKSHELAQYKPTIQSWVYEAKL